MRFPKDMANEILLKVTKLPVQQNRVYKTPEEAISCPKGDVILTMNNSNGIIENSAFDPNTLIYDENYQNEQALSITFQSHLEQVFKIIKRNFSNKTILEIGCGKGTFLKLLRNNGFEAIGIDPAYEGNEAWVIKQKFSNNINFKADVIVLRHVLEHIPKPLSFLRKMAEINDGGLIYIEVPCLDWICKRKAWFDIYYEHVNYFRMDNFLQIFSKIIENGHLFGGQYLYIVADLKNLRDKLSIPIKSFSFPRGFFKGLDYIIEKINSLIDKRYVIWGASSKGVIFTVYMQRKGAPLPMFAIDINPAKQGHFMAATGVPILSPEKSFSILRENDIVFVMNSNYLDEIIKFTHQKFQYYTID